MDEAIKEKWLRFLANKADENEIAEVLNYIRANEVDLNSDELNDLWDQLEAFPGLKQEHAKLIYQKVASGTKQEPRHESQFMLAPWMRAAASVIIVLSISLFAYRVWSDRTVSLEVFTGNERKMVTLEDGSQVILNLNSKLRYSDKFPDDKREIFLEGEAFFDVRKDSLRPFIVHSGDIETEVLGTSFEVTARKESNYEVAVATGKVKVVSHAASVARDLAVLTPGLALSYSRDDDSVVLSEIIPDEIAQWKDTVIHFDNESMDKVIKVLSRRYGVLFTIQNERIKNCRLSMKIEDESLQMVMEDIQIISSQAIEYSIKSNTIVLSGNGCDPEI